MTREEEDRRYKKIRKLSERYEDKRTNTTLKIIGARLTDDPRPKIT